MASFSVYSLEPIISFVHVLKGELFPVVWVIVCVAISIKGEDASLVTE